MKTSLLLSQRPMNGGHLVRALLDLTGELPEDAARAPLNVALVLDRSGSMAGARLEAAKQAASQLVRRLHPDDRIAVVAFDDEVTTVAEPGTAADHVAVSRAIEAISTGGTTNLSGGWLQGRALLADAAADYDVNRLILLSDGHANVGITDHARLRQLAAQAAEDGIVTTTIGVGGGYDEELMIAMADGGLGTGYYMERPDQATAIFDEELLGLLSICAQNISVRLQPTDAVEATAVLHSYPATAGDDNALTLSLGDLYAREPRRVLIEFAIAPQEAGAEAVEICGVQISADVLTAGGGMERRQIAMPISFSPGAGPVTHPEVQKTWLLLRASAARDEAVRRADDGDVEGASAMLRARGRELREQAQGDPEIMAQAEDLETVAERMDSELGYVAEDRKYLRTVAAMEAKGLFSAAEASRERRGRKRGE